MINQCVKTAVAWIGGLTLALGAVTATADEVAPETAKRIIDNLKQARGDLEYSEVKPSPIPGLYEVRVTRGPTLYVGEGGEFLVAGDLFGIQPNGFVNLQEQARAEERAVAMAKVDKRDAIVFAPDGETKAFVNVFTDVDCGYCQKLHREVPELNAMGIEVRYLGYPRAGIGSQSYKKLVTAWCADDPQTTLTKLKSGESVAIDTCDNNPVAEQYELGAQVGVTGTPSLVMDDGTMLPGYMPAEELAKALGVEPNEAGK